MVDQILSQEEIDALLSAMDKGEVDIEAAKDKELEAVPFDFTSQNVTLGEQFEMLEDVYEKFVKLLRVSLSSSLRRQMEVVLASTELMSYQEFLKDFAYPTSFNVLTMEPLYGSALLAIDPGFVFSVIDCMLGGTGKSLEQVREFTLIEQRVIRKFLDPILKDMGKAWEVIFPIRPSLKKLETKPQFVQLASATDLMIVTVFTAEGEGLSGQLHLCIPYLMLDPIKDKLTYESLRDAGAKYAHNTQIQDLLNETHVTIAAQLGNTMQTVRDILNLQVGDVIKLAIGPQDPITVAVEEVPKYQAVPGIVRGNRAVQVSSLLHKNGGANNHEHNRGA